MKRAALLCIMFGCIEIDPVNAADLYVSPQGNDRWSGSLAMPNSEKTDGPMATLVAARDAIRKRTSAGPLTQP
ncbi:MAG: hypothetical protein GX455_06545, partial [Phycisphaerae bacterium]|nr:hypothetical protein [Phycisphaerae bacterium]